MVLKQDIPTCGDSAPVRDIEQDIPGVVTTDVIETSPVSAEDYLQYVVDTLIDRCESDIEDLSIRGRAVHVTFFHGRDTADVVQLFNDLEMHHVRSGVEHVWGDKLPVPTVTYSISEPTQ